MAGLIRLWLFIAVPVTAMVLLVGGSVAVALVGGPGVATFVVMAMRRGSASSALAGLDRQQRGLITGALRRGAPVTDPELANRLLAYASAVLHERESARTSRIMAVGLLVVGVGVQLVYWATVGTVGWPGVLLLASGALSLLAMMAESRYLERVRQSMRATEGQWGIGRRVTPA